MFARTLVMSNWIINWKKEYIIGVLEERLYNFCHSGDQIAKNELCIQEIRLELITYVLLLQLSL